MIPEQKYSSQEGVKRPLNIILITLDALNYQLLIDDLSDLPNLLNLSRKSAFFTNAFSVGPNTFFAFPALIASVYPYHFGVGIDKNVKAIDQVLKENDYNTAIINELSPLLTPYYGYGTYIDYQRHILSLGESKIEENVRGVLLRGEEPEKIKNFMKVSLHLKRVPAVLQFPLVMKLGKYLLRVYRFAKMYFADNPAHFKRRTKLHARFVNNVTTFLNQSFKTPQFLWIHTAVNHMPYLPPDNTRFTTREIDYLNCRGLTEFVNRGIARRLKQLYIESLKTTDKLLGEVVSILSAKQLLDKSIIIITADHGEEFMEMGYFGHDPMSSSDDLLHVPLFIYCPQLVQPKNISTPISTIDIMPTICDLLSIDTPASSRGISYKNTLMRDLNANELLTYKGRPLFSEAWDMNGLLDRAPGCNSKRKIFTVRQGGYKLKLSYNRQNERDAIDKLDLTTWKTGRKLDTANKSRVTQQLINMLDEHLREDEVFADGLKKNAEIQRIRGKIPQL